MKRFLITIFAILSISVLNIGNIYSKETYTEIYTSVIEESIKGAREQGIESLEGVDDYTVTPPSPESIDTFMGRVGKGIRLVFRFIGSFFKEIASIFIKGSSS